VTPFPINSQELLVKVTDSNNAGRQIFELLEDLTFQYTVNGGSGFSIVVPKGFKTDFASIPRLFWRIFPPVGPYSKAAVIHDYLYQLPGCSRFLADAMLRECMFQLRVPIWKRLTIYYVVRFFGGLCRKVAK